MKIFITGSSGCIGHYVVEQLLQHTNHELYLLVRNPAKLNILIPDTQRVKMIAGDLHGIENFRDLIQQMDWAILMATAWGDPQETYCINVTQTLRLIELLHEGNCRHTFYFSTESILDRRNQLLPQAGELGTDYIRTKYLCLQQLERSLFAPYITVFFPTLVFGGDAQKPSSHLSAGLKDILKWLWLIRFFRVDASFHFLHAYDIAQVVLGVLEESASLEALPQKESFLPEPLESLGSNEKTLRKVILGNPALTVNQAIVEICQYCQRSILFQFPLWIWLANFFIWLFRVRMADWDRFCLQYRHFVHEDSVNPRSFQRQPYAETIADLLKVSGIPKKA